jgi:hypothetical protein
MGRRHRENSNASRQQQQKASRHAEDKICSVDITQRRKRWQASVLNHLKRNPERYR